MATVASKETERQYRVARQTLSIHAFLRDGSAFKSRLAEIVLLLSSVVFCATTFAADDLYGTFGLSAAAAHLALGLASVVAFGFSLTLLVVNWKDAWADHRDAHRRWADVVERFRSLRAEDGTWPDSARDQLNALYWETDRTTVPIPEKRFNGLKRRYLRKVAISELSSAYPACPTVLLALLVRANNTIAALRNAPNAESD
ncbi:MAG: hypothetical protein M1336_06395 [Deltaproteobacteria bacterium]|nr:hypothetical protein [Deltaproteobacteria bacterium]